MGVARGPVPAGLGLASLALPELRIDHIVIAADHRLTSREAVQPEDLDGERLLMVDRSDSPMVHDASVEFFTDRGLRPVWVSHGATQIERVLDMVASGMGCGWMNPVQAMRHRARGDVVVRPLTEAVRADAYVVAWHGEQLSAKARPLAKFIVEHFTVGLDTARARD